ncbi:helix-turn-helix domain-containing protein [Candidatus Pelagadaptatus aseana]|uniref:helix-turn-helix domain-containing protein n=1 Tax=Candidatus Pelagadaptatus aseana TaxID=3120508 RepID=UPI003C6F8CAE
MDYLASAPKLFRDVKANRLLVIACIETILMDLDPSASAEDVAKIFCVSNRTFFRKLRAADISFRDLCEEVKGRMAVRYLDTGEQSIASISDYMGYSDPSNFTKAFKKWMGCSPKQYRDTQIAC